MRGANFNSIINKNTGLCEKCGYENDNDLLVVNNESSRDTLILAIYIIWGFLVKILYGMVNKFIIPHFIAVGAGQKMVQLNSTLDYIISGIDILLIILIFRLLENKFVKKLFVVFLIFRVALFLLNRINL